jgi:gluconate 5-dehydrogenase
LVNCAVYCKGHGESSQIEFMSDEVFAYGVDGSIDTVFRATREVIPYMKKRGGSIINIASLDFLRN